jgi:hypothetical protein
MGSQSSSFRRRLWVLLFGITVWYVANRWTAPLDRGGDSRVLKFREEVIRFDLY